MPINGTVKSLVANHLAESIARPMTIKAFEKEDRFFVKTCDLIDINASPFFHSFAANEWLVQTPEARNTRGSLVQLFSPPQHSAWFCFLPELSTLVGIYLIFFNNYLLLYPKQIRLKSVIIAGFIGMALSYGLSLNLSLVLSIQNQCTLANYIISVERLNQYMHIPSEAPEVTGKNRPPVQLADRG